MSALGLVITALFCFALLVGEALSATGLSRGKVLGGFAVPGRYG